MKFERTKITLDVYGTVYELSRPSFKKAMDLSKKSEDMDELKSTDMMIDFLADLGLPKKVTLEMEIDHVSDIIEHVMPSKKK